jgi:hypothetical protein
VVEAICYQPWASGSTGSEKQLVQPGRVDLIQTMCRWINSQEKILVEYQWLTDLAGHRINH